MGLTTRSRWARWFGGCLLLALGGCGNGATVLESRWPDGGLKETRSAVIDANGEWLNHGPYTTYYMDGRTKAEEGAYEYGRLTGIIRHWHENGQLKDEARWEKGRVVEFLGAWDEKGNPLKPRE